MLRFGALKNPLLVSAVVFASLTFAPPTYAELLPLKSYSTAEGLPNNEINKIVRDARGFLWFCTSEGLSRFDGYSFKVFRSDPDDSGSIGSNFIHSLYEDPQGVLWVGTEKGLYRHNATTEIDGRKLPAARPVASRLREALVRRIARECAVPAESVRF